MKKLLTVVFVCLACVCFAAALAACNWTVSVQGITLSESAVTLEVGDEYEIQYNVYPAKSSDKSVTFTSSNEKIITVNSDGKVTAVAEGQAYVTAVTNDGGFSVNCAFTVKEKSYTITFKAEGEVISTQSFVLSNPEVDEPTPPEKEGYTADWECYSFSAVNITVNAVYVPIEYEAVFMYADGSVFYKAVYTVESTSVAEPDVPVKEHYVGRWENYTLALGGVTIYPVYTPERYNAVFMADGAEVSTVVYTVENWSVQAPDVPQKDGYTGVWESFELDFGGITVNAVYTAIKYTATFIANGATIRSVKFTVEDESIAEPAVPERFGYTGAWESYELTCSDITIVADYTAIIYNITYENCKGAENSNSTTYSIESTFPLAAITAEHYTFVGWYLDGEKINSTIGYYRDLTLTAEWEAVVYSVNFCNGNYEIFATETYTADDPTIDEPEVPVKEGYTGVWETYFLNYKTEYVYPVYTLIETADESGEGETQGPEETGGSADESESQGEDGSQDEPETQGEQESQSGDDSQSSGESQGEQETPSEPESQGETETQDEQENQGETESQGSGGDQDVDTETQEDEDQGEGESQSGDDSQSSGESQGEQETPSEPESQGETETQGEQESQGETESQDSGEDQDVDTETQEGEDQSGSETEDGNQGETESGGESQDAEGSGETEEPEEPQDGGETEEPDEPQDGGETEEPEEPQGGETEEPDEPQGSGEETGETDEPQGGGETEEPEEPQDGEETGEPDEPQDGDETEEPEEPQDGGETGETDEPQGGDETEEPDEPQGGETEEPEEPQGGEETGETDEPQGGEETGETDEPQDGGETEEPEEPQGGDETEEPEEPQGGDETGETDEPQDGGETGETDEPQGGDETGEADEPQDGEETGETDEPQDGGETGETDEPQESEEPQDGGGDEEEDPQGGEEQTNTIYVTFVADGETVNVVEYLDGEPLSALPYVPAKDSMVGEWESFSVADENIIVTALYTSENASNGLEYEDNSDGTLTVTGYTGGDSKVNVPAVYKNKTVTALSASAFSYNTTIDELVLPSTITAMGSGVLAGMSALTTLTVPFVGESAANSDGLMSNCFGYIFGAISYNGGVSVQQRYTLSGATTTYYLPTKLVNVTVLGGKLYYGAFWGCGNLTEIFICDGVTSIEEAAFGNCTALTTLTLPFAGSSKETSKATSQTLFGYCFGSVEYTGSTKVVQNYSDTNNATYYLPTKLKTVTITGGNIQYGTFYGCTSLTTVILGDEVTMIGDYAFNGCTKLTSVTIGAGVVSIGNHAFDGCIRLKTVTVSDGVETIGEYAFDGCTKLTTVTIGTGVTSIGKYAFDGCDAEPSVIFEAAGTWTVKSTTVEVTAGENMYDELINYKKYSWSRADQ